MRPSRISLLLSRTSIIIALLLPVAENFRCSAGAETGQDADAPSTLWQKELREALISTKAAPGFELELAGYRYRGQLQTKKEVNALLSEMFGPDVLFAVNGADSISFVPFRKASFPIPGHLRESALDLTKTIKPGMRVVDLTWSYRGREYHSAAVVSDTEGIIYDNIGTLAVIRRDKENSDDFSSRQCISTASEEITDGFGRRVLYCLVKFDSAFNGNGILSDIRDASDIYNLERSGWTCSPKVETLEGEIDVTRHRAVSATVSIERKPFLYDGRALGAENSSVSWTKTHSAVSYRYSKAPSKPKPMAKPAPPETGNSTPEAKDWRAELEAAMDAGDGTGFGSGLKLIGWTFRKRIGDGGELSEILAEILDRNSVTAINSGDSLRFTTLDELAAVPDTDAVCRYVDYGLSAVDLAWEYRGRSYSSVALVSDVAGILYDNIGTCVITDIKWKEEEINGTNDTYFGILGTLFDGFHRKAAEMKFLQKASFDSWGLLSSQSNRWDNNNAYVPPGCQVGFTGSVNIIGGKVHESDHLTFEWHFTATSPNGFKPEEGSPFTAGGEVTLSAGRTRNP